MNRHDLSIMHSLHANYLGGNSITETRQPFSMKPSGTAEHVRAVVLTFCIDGTTARRGTN